MQHFLKETDFTLEEAQSVFQTAKSYKEARPNNPAILDQQSWGLLFYKSSTRTRVSFEVGIHELGGFPIVLNAQNTQIGRGESVADSAKVLSRYLQGLVIRTFDHSIIEGFTVDATMPIVNGLTDFNHPCQLYSDLFTLLERFAPGDMNIDSLKGKKVTFLGDTACNMANSWIICAAYFGMEIALAGPEGFAPSAELDAALEANGLPIKYKWTTDAYQAVEGADVVYTDVWVSMGDEAEAETRLKQMAPYQVNSNLMNAAKKEAYFMHCLPAHPGKEVSQDVLDAPQSIIFDQAENRLHTQKAILAQLTKLNKV
ncbi:MAG: Ornithine carbamoyltransferase [Opitutia bacterium UBA7350]|nr:MAG: Ornithine carbamoyltransferase [Opitutae bacterium UBA7350]